MKLFTHLEFLVLLFVRRYRVIFPVKPRFFHRLGTGVVDRFASGAPSGRWCDDISHVHLLDEIVQLVFVLIIIVISLTLLFLLHSQNPRRYLRRRLHHLPALLAARDQKPWLSLCLSLPQILLQMLHGHHLPPVTLNTLFVSKFSVLFQVFRPHLSSSLILEILVWNTLTRPRRDALHIVVVSSAFGEQRYPFQKPGSFGTCPSCLNILIAEDETINLVLEQVLEQVSV